MPDRFQHLRRITSTSWPAFALILLYPLCCLLPIPDIAATRLAQIGYAAASLGWAALIWRCHWPRSRWPRDTLAALPFVWIIVVAVAARLPLLAAAPSDDVYRYVWEGMVRLEGVNPYAVAPDDERLAHLRPEWYESINHRDHAAVYPPTAQALFVALARWAPLPALFKGTFLVCDLLTIAVLAHWLRRTTGDASWVVVYALCPATLSAFAREAHLDALMVLGLALLIDRTDRPPAERLSMRNAVFAGVGLGLAIGTKWVALLAAPWFVMRLLRPFPRKRGEVWPPILGLTTAAGIVLVPAWWYLDHGWAAILGPLRYFAGEFHSLDYLRQLVLGILGADLARVATIALAGGVSVGVALLRTRAASAVLWTLGVLLLALPTLHPWYLVWLLPALCRGGGWPWLVMCASMIFAYEGDFLRETTGTWSQPDWVAPAVFVPFLLACAAYVGMRAGRILLRH